MAGVLCGGAPQQGAGHQCVVCDFSTTRRYGGVYCADCQIARALPSDGSTELHGVRPRAIDPVSAGRLWTLSGQLTGATLD